MAFSCAAQWGIFGEDGTLLKQLTHGAPLNQPWGFAIAPKKFGPFSNAITGQFVGALKDTACEEIHIDQLWGFGFGDGTGSNGVVIQLYFTVCCILRTILPKRKLSLI